MRPSFVPLTTAGFFPNKLLETTTTTVAGVHQGAPSLLSFACELLLDHIWMHACCSCESASNYSQVEATDRATSDGHHK